MCDAETRLGVKSFFMMDENFLLYKERAMELLDHMKATGKAWSLYVFSSANAISQVHDARAGRARHHLGLDGPRVAAERATAS